MTIEIAIVLIVVLCAVILFVTEKIPVDLVAVMILVTLLLSGIITAEEGLSGFSPDSAVEVGLGGGSWCVG